MTDETEYDEGRRYDLKYFINMAEDALDDVHLYSISAYDQRAFDAAATKAAVYSTLALASAMSESVKLKPEPKSQSQFFYFVNGKRVDGERCLAQLKRRVGYDDTIFEPCIKLMGHNDNGEMHVTEGGSYFND